MVVYIVYVVVDNGDCRLELPEDRSKSNVELPAEESTASPSALTERWVCIFF